ncbi:MAG: hypothetical protein ACI4CE_07465 [Methanomethylophilus alvi]
MSAYVVPDENLCKIAGYVVAILDAGEHAATCEGAGAIRLSRRTTECFRSIPGAYDPKRARYDINVIHRALYDMNRQAMIARYGECWDEYRPFSGTQVDVREQTRDEWQCRLFTVIRNFLSQCAEGKAWETELFQSVQELERVLAYMIATETGARDWGCVWATWKPGEKGERKSQMRDGEEK